MSRGLAPPASGSGRTRALGASSSFIGGDNPDVSLQHVGSVSPAEEATFADDNAAANSNVNDTENAGAAMESPRSGWNTVVRRTRNKQRVRWGSGQHNAALATAPSGGPNDQSLDHTEGELRHASRESQANDNRDESEGRGAASVVHTMDNGQSVSGTSYRHNYRRSRRFGEVRRLCEAVPDLHRQVFLDFEPQEGLGAVPYPSGCIPFPPKEILGHVLETATRLAMEHENAEQIMHAFTPSALLATGMVLQEFIASRLEAHGAMQRRDRLRSEGDAPQQGRKRRRGEEEDGSEADTEQDEAV